MLRRRSTFRREAEGGALPPSSSGPRGPRVMAAAVLACAIFAPARALAQACCAGSGTVTPARLAMHEQALAGLTLRGAAVMGSYDPSGHYTKNPARASELDFEEDLFGAIKVLRRGQLAAFVPVVETRRAAGGTTDFGGGLGDVNVGARYDFVNTGEYLGAPGVALLAGLTLPTGRAPESASGPLAADATGTGAVQTNFGVAFEQTIDDWLFSATTLVALRSPRDVRGVRERLGLQITELVAAAYSFSAEEAAGVVVSYTIEDEAVVGGLIAPMTARRIATISLVGVMGIADGWRVQGALAFDPPISGFGKNLPATTGLSISGIRAF